jgi:ABC-type transport system substrate-binding protein
MLKKKSLLAATTLVAAIVVAIAAGGAFSAAADEAAAPRLEGTWLSTVTLENPPTGVDPTFLALNTFGRSGEVVVSSSQGLPTSRSLAKGEWKRTANGQYECSFMWFRFDATGKFVGTQRVRRTMTLGPSLDTFESTDIVELIAPNGTVIATANATEVATRLGV